MTWEEDLRDCFPDWRTDAALSRWFEARTRLSVGQRVHGRVVARAPFGVWVDISAGHPALLLVPEMAGAREHRMTFEEYPAMGAVVDAWIRCLGDDATIALSQDPQVPTHSASDHH